MKGIDLLPHNQKTYKSILEGWKTKDKVAVVQATGTGKSYLILSTLGNFLYEKKIVLAPSNYILEHLKTLANGSDFNTEYITYSKLLFSDIGSDYALIVLDEFHRGGANKWGKEIYKLIEKNPQAKILGTSATPIRFLDSERDMSDELFDGNVVSNLSLTDAIAQGILPLPRYISSIFSVKEQFDKLEKKVSNSFSENKEEITSEIKTLRRRFDKSKGGQKIIEKYIKGESTKKLIVFCKDVEHLEEMSRVIPQWFSGKEVEVKKVYSGHRDSNIEFEQFENKKIEKDNKVLLLFSIDMLNEGVHVENIDGVILLRPTISPIIYYQQIGRAIQAGNKRNPLIFDFVNNFNEIGSGQFINDLRSSVESLRLRGEHTVDIDEFLIVDEVKEIKEIFDSIESRLISSWDYWYEKLCEFKKENGHTRVQRSSISTGEEKGLAKWVSSMRNRKDTLSKERIELLEKIGFTWNVDEEKWFEMFDIFKEYIEEHGTPIMPSKCCYKGAKLGYWVSYQRLSFKEGQLSLERQELLNSVGFAWNNKVYEWIQRIKAVEEHYNNYGDFNISRRVNGDVFYTWFCKFKKHVINGTLPDSLVSHVDRLGTEFYDSLVPKKDKIWFERFNEYKEKMVNNYVMKEDDIYLWRWACSQRANKNKGTLTQDRINKLDSIGFIWNDENERKGRIIKNNI